jgi:hypothetical protein
MDDRPIKFRSDTLLKLSAFFLIVIVILSVIPKSSEEYVNLYSMQVRFDLTTDWVRFSIKDIQVAILNASFSISQGNEQITHIDYDCQNIFVNKSQFDKSHVIATINIHSIIGIDTLDKINILIQKGHIGDVTTSIITGADDAQIEITRFIYNGNIDPGKKFSFSTYKITNQGPTNVMIKGIKEKTIPQVLAFHYPWYGNTSVTGQWVHWYTESSLTSTNNPSWGLYDSKDIKLIDLQIHGAKENGIDGFIVSWWGIGSLEDEAFNLILNRATTLDFKITIYYETYRNSSLLRVDQSIDELEYVLKKYASDNGFLTLNEHPVIFVYHASNYSPEFWGDVFKEIRNKGYNVLWIGDTLDPRYYLVFDGLHSYSGARDLYLSNEPLDKDGTYTSYARIQNVRDALGRLWFAPTTPSFAFWNETAECPYLSGNNGKTYSELWRIAMNSNPDGITITSWNEWHEGSEIEPSIEKGKTYLHLTEQFSKEFKDASKSKN